MQENICLFDVAFDDFFILGCLFIVEQDLTSFPELIGILNCTISELKHKFRNYPKSSN